MEFTACKHVILNSSRTKSATTFLRRWLGSECHRPRSFTESTSKSTAPDAPIGFTNKLKLDAFSSQPRGIFPWYVDAFDHRVFILTFYMLNTFLRSLPL